MPSCKEDWGFFFGQRENGIFMDKVIIFIFIFELKMYAEGWREAKYLFKLIEED